MGTNKADFRLGELTVRPELNELLRDGVATRLDPLLMDILVNLVENAPQIVSANELLERFWAGAVVEESTIHRRISQIRQALGDNARNPIYIATVPKRGYRIVADIKQIEEVAKPSPPEIEQPSPPVSSQPDKSGTKAMLWASLAAAVVLIGLGFQTLLKDAPTEGPANNILKIAVLPLQDFGAENNDAHLASGFQEDIIARLAQIGDFQVTSRTSVQRYADPDTSSIEKIALELGVSHVIEGSIRRDGELIRVTLQLIDVEDDDHIWAQTYDRKLTDLFGIQSDIAHEVARQLSQKLSPAQSRRLDTVPTLNMQAYDLVLRGRQLIDVGTRASLEQAARLFEDAIQQDPLLASAHEGFARALFLQTFLGTPWIDVQDRVLQASEKALELDPKSATINANYAHIVEVWGQEDLSIVEKHYLRALEIDPSNAFAQLHYGAYLSKGLGKPDIALPYLQRARALNPLSGEVGFYLGSTLVDLGRHDDAYTVVERVLEFDPHDIDLNGLHLQILANRGVNVALFQLVRDLILMDPESVDILSTMVYARIVLGELEAAQSWVDRIESLSPVHQIYFDTQAYTFLASQNIDGLNHLISKWQALNSGSRMRNTETDGHKSFEKLNQPLLLFLRANQARAAGQSKVERALRENAVEISKSVLRNDVNSLEVNYVNQHVALIQAVNLKLLGKNQEADEVLDALLRTGDKHDIWQRTAVLAAQLLSGDNTDALQFMATKTPNLLMQPLLDALHHNQLGLFDDFVSLPEFAPFYADAKRQNAELKTRLNSEFPTLMNATTGL